MVFHHKEDGKLLHKSVAVIPDEPKYDAGAICYPAENNALRKVKYSRYRLSLLLD